MICTNVANTIPVSSTAGGEDNGETLGREKGKSWQPHMEKVNDETFFSPDIVLWNRKRRGPWSSDKYKTVCL